VQNNISKANQYIESYFGKTSYLPTEKEVQAEQVAVTRKMVSDFYLQTAPQMDREAGLKYLEGANQMAGQGMDGKDIFGPEEMAKLKDSYEKAHKAYKYETDTAIEQAQTAKANEAFAVITPHMENGEQVQGNYAGAQQIIINSQFDSDWKNTQLNMLDSVYNSLANGKKNPLLVDGSLEKKKELTTKAVEGTLTLKELNKWHGQPNGISTATYTQLATKIAKPDDYSLGVKAYFDEMQRMARDGDISMLGYHTATTMLNQALHDRPDLNNDPIALATYYDEELAPVMFGVAEEGGFWKNVLNWMVPDSLFHKPPHFRFDETDKPDSEPAKDKQENSLKDMTLDELTALREKMKNADTSGN